MSRAHRLVLAALVVATSVVASCVVQLPARPAAAATLAAPRPVDAWAWCGVHPDDPAAARAARSMAVFAGIEATFGPCNDGPVDYTPAEPGTRYASPAIYMRLVQINAEAGMQTVVYDNRVWSQDASVRAVAKAFWRPMYEHIAAWDMGDEFDPTSSQWQTLIARIEIVLADVTVDSSIHPFTNHLATAVDEALRDVPESNRMLSFDQYDGDQGVAIARTLDARVDVLMCAVNAFKHGPTPGVFAFDPTSESIRDHTSRLVGAGCDMILVFGGAQVYGSAKFGPQSIIDTAGTPTALGTAVLESTGSSNYVPVSPARLLETRVGVGLSTVDGQANGIGALAAGTETELQVSGRGSIGLDASSVVLTVTAINALTPGFISVYPCGTIRPNVAQVNHPAGSNVATTVIVKVSASGPASGKVCLFNLAATDLVVDAAGYFPPGT
ncbi:MAG: hypothetical protein ABIW84_08025, partial [Ilumatobacteraceae bacterium]